MFYMFKIVICFFKFFGVYVMFGCIKFGSEKVGNVLFLICEFNLCGLEKSFLKRKMISNEKSMSGIVINDVFFIMYFFLWIFVIW